MSGHPKRVSVIIPCYNRSQVIGRAVRSVLQQTYPNLEIIVVDDGSSDSTETEEAIRKLGDERISLLCLASNQGGAAARNIGAARATGELVAFLDSDDEWLPEKLEVQVRLLECLNESSGSWLVGCRADVRTFGEKSALWPVHLKGDARSVGDYLFVDRGFLQTSSFVMTKSDFMDVQFSEDLRRHQDFDFLLRWDSRGWRIRIAEEVLYILHWEDYHISQRGFIPDVTVRFLEDYRPYLSPSAQSNFIYCHLIGRLFSYGRRKEALQSLRLLGFSFRLLTGANKLGLLSQIFLNNSALLSAAVRLKSIFSRS
jgi:glycosyltransferase involved in cell wall biosynthesis